MWHFVAGGRALSFGDQGGCVNKYIDYDEKAASMGVLILVPYLILDPFNSSNGSCLTTNKLAVTARGLYCAVHAVSVLVRGT